MSYQKHIRINYFDCDSTNRLKLSTAMQYMQQTSSEHLEALNISPQRLLDQNMVFLLTKMCIKVHRMPHCTEEVIVETAPIEIRGVRFIREFAMETTRGERLLSALSLWVLVNPSSHKIIRPSSFPYPLPLQTSILGGAIHDLPFPKMLPKEERLCTNIKIRYSHLDINQHVNNCVYGDFVCDAIPYPQLIVQGLDTVVIHFQQEARWGESITINTSVVGDGEFHLLGLHEDGRTCFEAYAGLGEAVPDYS